MPGFGAVLAATFIAQIGGNLDNFETVDRLACVAGLAQVPHDSRRVAGTFTGLAGSIAGCYEPATSQRYRVSRTAPHPELSTTANAPKESHTNKPSSLSPAGGST